MSACHYGLGMVLQKESWHCRVVVRLWNCSLPGFLQCTSLHPLLAASVAQIMDVMFAPAKWCKNSLASQQVRMACVNMLM